MYAAFLVLASAAVGADWGYRPLPGGGVEYIVQVEPRALVAPGLVLGATDARHYQALSPAVYRFLPVLLKPDDLARVHGTNERIAVEDYRRAVRFYVQLLRRAAL